MTKFTEQEYTKAAGGTLSHTEWNKAAQNINDLIDASGNAGGGGSVSSAIAANLELTGSDGNNMTIKSAKHLNLEPSYKTYDSQNQTWSSDNNGDLQLKPGDDIALYSHHRSADKRDEVSLKVLDGADKPVKLLIQAGEITLQAKLKNLTKKKDTTTGEDNTGTADADYLYKDDQANVFDINVTTEYKPNRGSGSKKSGKGYLKVRAQAIDLRCEENGGIALQPKGTDGQGHMNKIKFEHGGGDGLEFGTFNTEHTSLFTNDYRFNKNGVIKLATRTTEASDKADANDPTTALKYVKADDDFYDNIDNNDPTCTWSDIVEVGSRMDSVNAYYVVPVTYDEQEVDGPNGTAMMVQALNGTFSRINGATAAIIDTSFSLSDVFNLDTISATDIQNLEQTSGDTKYVRSNAINTVFGLSTGSSGNQTVQQFINTFYQDGKAVFQVGLSMYCLVNSTDVCDFEFQIDDNDKRLSMSDLYTLVSHMKSNGLWTVA